MQNITRAAALSTATATAAIAAPAATQPQGRAVALVTSCSGSIPLPYGHWYGTNDGTPFSHSGIDAADRGPIATIQVAVNRAEGVRIPVDGRFGPITATGVRSMENRLNTLLARDGRSNRLPLDGQVGAAVWYFAWEYGYLC